MLVEANPVCTTISFSRPSPPNRATNSPSVTVVTLPGATTDNVSSAQPTPVPVVRVVTRAAPANIPLPPSWQRASSSCAPEAEGVSTTGVHWCVPTPTHIMLERLSPKAWPMMVNVACWSTPEYTSEAFITRGSSAVLRGGMSRVSLSGCRSADGTRVMISRGHESVVDPDAAFGRIVHDEMPLIEAEQSAPSGAS
eukprot:scaffold10720_cov69-Phaeocystis_antarctica.AAC.17